MSFITKSIVIFFCCILLVILGCHVFFLQDGTWHVDEYDYIYSLQSQGIGFSLKRWLIWSPRPFAEFLTYLYARAVLLAHAPLTGPVLAGMWFFGFILSFILFFDKAYPLPPILRGMVSLLVAVFFLLGHPVADMYYWPMATFAYLPTLGSITALCFLYFYQNGVERNKVWPEFLFLLLCLTSSEAGMLFVLVYTFCSILILIAGNPKEIKTFLYNRSLWCWAVTFCMAFALLLLARQGRVHSEHYANSAIGGHWLSSFRHAGPSFFKTLIAFEPKELSLGLETDGNVKAGLLLKPFMFLGFYCIFLYSIVQNGMVIRIKRLIPLLCGMLGTVYLTIFFTYFTYGVLLGQRYISFQMDLVVLVVLILSVAAAEATHAYWKNRGKRMEWFVLSGVLSFCIVVGVMAMWRVPVLWEAFSLHPVQKQDNVELWKTGLEPGQKIILKQCGFTPLTYAWVWERGDYALDAPPSTQHEKARLNYSQSRPVMLFFHKKEIAIFSPFLPGDCPRLYQIK